MVNARPSPRVLYIIACGGRPAGDLPRFVRYAQDEKWDVCVIATPSGMKFLDSDHLASLTGHPVRCDYKRPDGPDVLPAPDAFVVSPATFNTINKLAAGISDTLALGLLNEAVGTGLPIIAVPFPNQMLARHPAFRRQHRDTAVLGGTADLQPRATPTAGTQSGRIRQHSVPLGNGSGRTPRPAGGPT